MNHDKTAQREMLIVRLAAPERPIAWRLTCPGDPQREACGEWSATGADSTLPDLAQRYPAWVLVPASDCAFHHVTLPAGLRKAPQQVVPFLLEEQLATDVDETHFALLHRQREHCAVAAIARQKMAAWLTRCDEPGLNILALTPDVLTLPCHPDRWSAVQADDQWLIRQDAWRGMAVETPWLAELLAAWETLPPIDCYSPPPATSVPWRAFAPQDVLALAAANPAARRICLRQGAFAPKRRWQPAGRRWPTLAAAAALALLWSTNTVLDHLALSRQADAAREASQAFYRHWFKNDKNVINPRLQMQQHLRQLEATTATSPLVAHIRTLQNMVSDTPGIQLRALTWDAARNALQLDISAVSSRALEQFTARAQAGFRVRTGEMKPRPDGIEGRLTLEGNDG
ncbi:type II secretion system protein GspL [Raoultella ornithinolytica]|uniref:type II secretion system protein GspL n=1 Tax=Raoultella ornithinolytica TaxID=54291 RepID=UPI0040374A6E